MKTNNKNYTLIHVSCFFFVFFFCGSCCLLRTQCSYLTLICHLTAGVTSSSKILGLGQTPVEVRRLAQLNVTGQHFCHFRRYDSFRHCSSVFKCRSLAFIADERLESVVERIWAIFNLYVLPFFVVVVVVLCVLLFFYHNALIAFRRSRVAKFWYFPSSFKFSFVLSRLANFLAYFLFILSAFFQCRVL